jgi:NTE family protein
MLGQNWVDGGTRNVTPVDAAQALGANPMYVLVAGTAAPTLPPNTPPFNQQGVAQIFGRAILGIVPNALQQYAIANPPAGASIIQPTTSIHTSLQIDPGLISISMAYGFMRAAEIAAFGSLSNPLSPISDQIAQARFQCWSVENIAFASEFNA